MKNFLLTIASILISIISLHASNISNIGDEETSLIKNEVLSLNLDNEAQLNLIVSSKYCNIDNCVSLEFQNELTMVQLYNSDGELDMMFPVASKKVHLGMSLFKTGTYKIGFMIDGESKVEYAQISIK